MDKYYKPSIEEFHVGFRYQETLEATLIDDGKGNTWSNTDEVTEGDLRRGFPDIHTNYRTKYLDQQDIEELGWEYLGKHWFYKNDVCYRIAKENLEYGYMEYYWLHIGPDEPTALSIVVGDENGYTLEGGPYLFDGQIKNFNNLKTLMKWLGIKQ